SFRQPFSNHNGGMIAFGPDGFVYIATGDGGSGGDPQGNGQNLETLLGKILRIDIDADAGSLFTVPPDNPFVGNPGREEVWAYGLRNPWRFSFDRMTGRMFAADVGQNSREEVDVIVKGGNYGWNTMEGTLCFSPPSNCNTAGLILPIDEYGRDLGFSVTGGYVYRGPSAPSLWGKYVFADFGSGRLWALTEVSPGQWQREQLLETGLSISSFGEDDGAEVYVVDLGGSVWRIVEPGAPQPAVNAGGVVNAASFLLAPVAPGQIVSIFGSGIGPGQGVGGKLDPSGRVDSLLADTMVLFDGVPAPLFFVRADQINAQVPYAVAGKTSTAMQVHYKGVPTNPVTLPVAGSAPAIFALVGGTGQGVILNQDMTLNTSANPAPRDSIVVLYATGEGQTDPSGMDGNLAEAPFPEPLLPVSLSIGGLLAEILFAAVAPGFAGLLQVNARIPAGVVPGDAVPVLLTIGNAASQPGLTLAVE
ncbi:MAG: PQQ-dependent sugar dehydrogenase, partial [Acidobacteria bacterium]|nr:PQQ-dependent sugar dehydrogenase [Acidobacteriota bacterium]